MTRKRTLIAILLVSILLGAAPILSMASPTTSPPAQDEPPPPTNLLQNPGFEGITCRPGSIPPECLDNWSNSANHDGSTHDNIFTPQAWTTWWRTGGEYGQPEVKTIPNVAPFTGELPRIRSGYYAVMLFTYYRQQDTGLYQCVSGLQPGATVQLSAYAHGWCCDDKNAKIGYSCGDPFNQSFRVGIEPNGLADPFAPSVIWSEKQYIPDHYGLVGPLSAQVGEGGRVCVFLRSKTKWVAQYNDAYWDDVSLVYTSPPATPTSPPPPPPPPPTIGPTPTPRATATPHPDGTVIHTVAPGDTIFGIALMYGVDPDQIRQLNAGSINGDIIQIGQQLVIAQPNQPPAPPPEPEATPAESAAAPEAPPAEGGAGGASICVLAFHDRNGDTFRDETTEELLPNAQFTLADASGVVAQYTSNGVNEPYCFAGLTTGAYRVIQDSPPGYEPSGHAEWAVPVPTEDTNLDIQFGNVRGEGTTAAGEETGESNPTETEDSGSGGPFNIFLTLARVSGVLVLILAAGMAVLFVINRQRVM